VTREPTSQVAPLQSTDVVLATGEVINLEDLLEQRWSHALIAWEQGDPAQLLELGGALAAAASLAYRLKARCDERVRDAVLRLGTDNVVAGYHQATMTPGATEWVDEPGLRDDLLAAGMDEGAVDQFFKLAVRDGRRLRTLGNRNEAVGHAIEQHTKRGNARVTYKRIDA
jgi:hypothetical protein